MLKEQIENILTRLFFEAMLFDSEIDKNLIEGKTLKPDERGEVAIEEAEKAIQALIDREVNKAVERKVKRRIDECSYCGNRVYPMVFHEKCSHSDYRADLWEKACQIPQLDKPTYLSMGMVSLQDLKEILNIKE